MPITISEAIEIFESAFRTKNPSEIEEVLRESIDVKVAIINSPDELIQKIKDGYYPITISVPYSVFISKLKERGITKIYEVKFGTTMDDVTVLKVNINTITPGKTYFLLKDDAGYSSELGLTFRGKGEVTGFEKVCKGEIMEKFEAGKDQSWEDHAKGTYKEAIRILEIYKPFIISWLESVSRPQNLDKKEIEETVDAIILAIKIAAFFHDIGKLRKEWQESVRWKSGQPYLARTKEKYRVPFHGPYAYPFLKKFLRNIFGDYRFLDVIALATARHHSLEVTGSIKPNMFQLVDNETVAEYLANLTLNVISEMKDVGYDKLKKIIEDIIKHVNQHGSLMDEPPSPSDDFYFIYTVTNRVIKFADWCDAGGETLELSTYSGGIYDVTKNSS